MQQREIFSSKENDTTARPTVLLRLACADTIEATLSVLSLLTRKACRLYLPAKNALWPEDHNISKPELVQCWIELGLLPELADMDEALRFGHSVIAVLEAARLLEQGDNHRYNMFPSDTHAPQERWTILAGISNVVEDEEASRIFRPGAEFSVAYNQLPSFSVLTVPVRLSSKSSPYFFPYIAAADSSGLLLLRAIRLLSPVQSKASYHICDARTGEVISLRDRGPSARAGGSNVGLVVRGDRCMVAELLPRSDGSGIATLLCYTVGEYQWVEMELTYSPPLAAPSRWSGEGVVSHGGMLWWVDLSYGILACDPFADEPELLHVPFPRVIDELPPDAGNVYNRSTLRCLKVSGRRLRFVQIHGGADAPVVSTWALADPASAGEWNLENSVRLADVWADESYLNTLLPRSVPALALLHPADHNKAYFFLCSHVFAVDLQRGMVVEFSEFMMPEPPRHMMISSHFVHAWQYDPSRSKGPADDFVPTCLMKEKEFTAMRRCISMLTPYFPVHIHKP
ncbi:hypothetical protein EJB05_07320, partial [Eragrostis curvula]